MNNGVFIPIRLDSERLPEKSLKLVNEKPILYYFQILVMDAYHTT